MNTLTEVEVERRARRAARRRRAEQRFESGAQELWTLGDDVDELVARLRAIIDRHSADTERA